MKFFVRFHDLFDHTITNECSTPDRNTKTKSLRILYLYIWFNIILNGCLSQCELDDDEFDFYVERKCNRKIFALHLHNVRLIPKRNTHSTRSLQQSFAT